MLDLDQQPESTSQDSACKALAVGIDFHPTCHGRSGYRGMPQHRPCEILDRTRDCRAGRRACHCSYDDECSRSSRPAMAVPMPSGVDTALSPVVVGVLLRSLHFSTRAKSQRDALRPRALVSIIHGTYNRLYYSASMIWAVKSS